MDDRGIREILQEARVVAVVGLSPSPTRPSHRVAAYLKEQGYRIIPIRPGVEEILGEKAYPSLEEIPPEIHVDVVDVFRRPEEVLPVAEGAVALGAKVLWLQEGIVNTQAAEIARSGGLQVIMDRCMLKIGRAHV